MRILTTTNSARKSLLIISILCLFQLTTEGQQVEITGTLKVTSVTLDNSADKVVVRKPDGVLGVRDASTLMGMQGPQGVQGINGTNGAIGPQGIPGLQGETTAGFGVSITGDGTSTVPYIVSTSGHYVGELYAGGIVFYLSDDKQNGLTASLRDLDGGAGVEWGLYGTGVPGAASHTDGDANTLAIIQAGGLLSEAAGLCDTFSAGGYTDWYLPSLHELKQMDFAVLTINTILLNDADPATIPLNTEYIFPIQGGYWNSTENSMYQAWLYRFPIGRTDSKAKNSLMRVRAIRSF